MIHPVLVAVVVTIPAICTRKWSAKIVPPRRRGPASPRANRSGHAFHDQNATQEGKSDCQAQGEDLDRTELRQQDLRGNEGPAKDDDGG